jgi:hypothetical protein
MLMNRTSRLISILLLVVFTLSACSSDSGSTELESNESDRVGPSAAAVPVPGFPSIQETFFCGLKDDSSELNSSLAKVEEGIASYKDLSEPLLGLVQGLDFAGSLLDRPDLFTSNPELADWISESQIPSLTEWLDTEYLWFARKRVRLMDYNEYSLPELKTRAAKVTAFVDSYCEGRE